MNASSRPRTRDPLAPVEGIVRLLLWFAALAVLLAVVVGGGGYLINGKAPITYADFGADEVCVVVDNHVGNVMGPTEGVPYQVVDVRPGVARFSSASWDVCLTEPRLRDRLVGSLGATAPALALVLACWLLLRAVTSARTRGLFAPPTVARVSLLARALLAAALAVPCVIALCEGFLTSVAMRDVSWLGATWNAFSLSWGSLVVALGVVTIARVLQHAAVLQDEVDHLV